MDTISYCQQENRYLNLRKLLSLRESTYNAGDPSSIPRLGRSVGEEIGYPLQYFGASLVAQLVKNPPSMQETWLQSLGWQDALKKGKATHSSILGLPWWLRW